MKENGLYDDFKMKVQNETKKKLLSFEMRSHLKELLDIDNIVTHFTTENIDYHKFSQE